MAGGKLGRRDWHLLCGLEIDSYGLEVDSDRGTVEHNCPLFYYCPLTSRLSIRFSEPIDRGNID